MKLTPGLQVPGTIIIKLFATINRTKPELSFQKFSKIAKKSVTSSIDSFRYCLEKTVFFSLFRGD